MNENQNAVKAPYYSEETKMWAVDSYVAEGNWAGTHTHWYKTQPEAQQSFDAKIAQGYALASEIKMFLNEVTIVLVEETQPDPALSDSPTAMLPAVLTAAATQERVHPRDISFIMDNLSVRQCRAFAAHQGFAIDSFSPSLAWAVELGLLEKSGAITPKGHAFYQAIV